MKIEEVGEVLKKEIARKEYADIEFRIQRSMSTESIYLFVQKAKGVGETLRFSCHESNRRVRSKLICRSTKPSTIARMVEQSVRRVRIKHVRSLLKGL